MTRSIRSLAGALAAAGGHYHSIYRPANEYGRGRAAN